MKIEHRYQGEISIVRILEDVDAGNAGEFCDFLSARVSAGDRRMILDFSAVKFMDSSGIGAILAQYQALKPLNGKIVLAGCNNSLQKIFQIVGMASLFPMITNVEKAGKYLLEN